MTRAEFIYCPACSERNIPGEDACWNCLADLTNLDLPVTGQPDEGSDLNRSLDTIRLRKAVTLDLPATVGDAVELLRTDPGSGVLLLDGGRLAGIFTERDVLHKVAGMPETMKRSVTEFMTPDPVVLNEMDRMNIVLHKMGVGGFRHLPVLREGEIVGVVTANEVMRWVLLQYFD
jgi:CBS domain-containing protein